MHQPAPGSSKCNNDPGKKKVRKNFTICLYPIEKNQQTTRFLKQATEVERAVVRVMVTGQDYDKYHFNSSKVRLKVIAVPLFISSYSPIIRQTEYLFGKRDSLADRPMPLMHHSEHYVNIFDVEVDSSRFRHGMLFPSELPRISKTANIKMTEALDSHDVVAEILRERILAMSEDLSNETVLIVAHGPNSEADNEMWIQSIEELIQKIQTNQEEQTGGEFKQVFGTTVRDDAPEPIFNQAKANLQMLVRQANLNGDVIVVPLFLSSGGREQAVAERLEGLNFKWTGETLLPNDSLSDFLMNSVEAAE